MNGFSEVLRFNGTTVDDGIVVAGSDPTIQPYDGTVNTAGVATSYGVDVDTFDVTALLAPGQTSATTQFSAGGDLVLLTAQVVSATSEPVVDLSLTKTHAGNFTVGGTNVYTADGFERSRLAARGQHRRRHRYVAGWARRTSAASARVGRAVPRRKS